MKLLFIIFLVFSITVSAQNWKDLKKAATKVNKELKKATNNLINFTEEEAASALRQALIKGVDKGVKTLSITNGFYKNPKVKIPFPPEAEKIRKQLKKIGMGKKIDKVVLSINRAAEDAVHSAGPIFIDAIKKMTLVDAIGIIRGHKTAGTDYLYNNTNVALVKKFRPNIKSSLKKVNATKYWSSVMKAYNKIPFVKKINPNLELYVTQKAIEGLFSVLAEEEIAIRENPVKRTTDILKKVFGS